MDSPQSMQIKTSLLNFFSRQFRHTCDLSLSYFAGCFCPRWCCSLVTPEICVKKKSLARDDHLGVQHMAYIIKKGWDGIDVRSITRV